MKLFWNRVTKKSFEIRSDLCQYFVKYLLKFSVSQNVDDNRVKPIITKCKSNSNTRIAVEQSDRKWRKLNKSWNARSHVWMWARKWAIRGHTSVWVNSSRRQHELNIRPVVRLVSVFGGDEGDRFQPDTRRQRTVLQERIPYSSVYVYQSPEYQRDGLVY